mgnify:CR=1 FL=1
MALVKPKLGDDVLQTDIDQTEAINEIGLKTTNENGTFYKFPSGLLICEHKIEYSTVINISIGPLFRENDAQIWTFPHPFVELPSVSIESVKGQVTHYTSGLYNDRTVFRAMAFVSSSATQNLLFSVIAIGRWK